MTLMSQTNYFVRTVLLALTLVIVGCGQPAEESTSEVNHILLPADEVGLTRHVYSETIEVCLQKGGESSVRGFISDAINEWLKPMRELNPRVTKTVSFSCPGHIDIAINSGVGRAFTFLSDHPTVVLFDADPYLPYKIMHEIGHAFGLGDTYEAKGDTCMNDHESSVMCRANSRFLQEDDRNGAQSIFERTWGWVTSYMK